MKTIARGCLELLLIWAGAGYALYSRFHGQFAPPGDFYGALGGGFAIASAWGCLRNVIVALQQRRLISASLAGAQPQDGKAYAVTGTVQALGQPLAAPFTKRQAVIVSYEFFREVRRRVGRGSQARTETVKEMYLSGYAMCPWAIRGSTREVRIIGFPFPEDFPEERFNAGEFEAEIRDLVQKTPFLRLKKFELGKMFGKLKELLLEDDGVLKEDWRFEEADDVLDQGPGAFAGLLCSEQIVPVGDEVCAIGTYSMVKQGLIQDFSTGGLQLLPGGAAGASRSLGWRAFWYGFCCLFLLALGTLLPHFVLQARERSPELVKNYEEQFLTALDQNDLAAAAEAMDKGVSPNLIDSSSSAAILRIRSEQMFKLLLKHGLRLEHSDSYGNTPLAAALYRRNWQLVDWLLAAGADPSSRHPLWRTTAAERAYDAGDFALYEKLSQKGGAAEIVPRRPELFRRDDPEGLSATVEKFVAALDSSDAAAARAVTDNWPDDFFESVARGLYANARGSARSLLGVLAEGDTAMLFVSGSGGNDLYVYTLVRRGDEWKIRRESWDEFGNWRPILQSF